MSAHPQVRGRLIAWDTKVHPDNDIEVSSDCLDKFHKMKLKELNGGTTLSSYTDHVEKKGYTCKTHIVLTDGCVEEKPKTPPGKCVFVLCKGGDDKIVKNYGEVVWIND
jgi:predicted metal-dependent peptidase